MAAVPSVCVGHAFADFTRTPQGPNFVPRLWSAGSGQLCSPRIAPIRRAQTPQPCFRQRRSHLFRASPSQGQVRRPGRRHLDVECERYVDVSLGPARRRPRGSYPGAVDQYVEVPSAGVDCPAGQRSSRLGSTQIGQEIRSAATAADSCHDSITARCVGVGRSLVPAVKTVSCLFVNEAEPGNSAFFNNPAESVGRTVAGRPEG